jgi:hypothetical protein
VGVVPHRGGTHHPHSPQPVVPGGSRDDSGV